MDIQRIASQMVLKSIKEGNVKLTHEYKVNRKIPTKNNINYVKDNIGLFKTPETAS
jgi:hypothetical protein